MNVSATSKPAVLLGPGRPELVRDETLGDLFRASAARFGGKTALVFGNAQLSQGEVLAPGTRWAGSPVRPK